MPSQPMHLVLVGGGHAMLPSIVAAKDWVSDGVRVTLVTNHRYLYYSGMVPEYLGGVYDIDQVRIDLKALADDAGIELVEEAATRLDSTARVLTTDAGTSLSYDLLAFDIGGRNPGTPSDSVIETKPLHHIERLGRWLDTLTSTPVDTPPAHLVVAGGGAAGIEVALNISARFSPDTLSMTIVEAGARILSQFPDAMSRRVHQMLDARGVRILLNQRVADVTPTHVHLSPLDDALPYDQLLWATGSVGNPLFNQADLPCDDRGFVQVLPTLQCPTAPRVFAAGDCATVQGYETLKKVGVHAVKQGPVLQANLQTAYRRLQQNATLDEDALEAFKPYLAAPLILSSGTSRGFWTSGTLWFEGRPLLRMKHFVDKRWLRTYAPEAIPERTWLGWMDAEAAATATA